ncbi:MULTISPECIES: Spy/CpxP family protein refolding chaperone [unclassified Coleofasciculus]|uniref:Spy/CpxP family protein refolding chaperone n=1 Tax=unclassified Coleofasciculus TaxID=2692782 RepID=UPI0018803967|nr:MULTISPECIES: Spy/CpxP family protein refolding chaperone [unclassified Coleofasciculus]MBE9127136.1 Spy/CpxP family protein refolding chaperone [Coleofasciculus sp. LEGE 07081]MBE9152322.1 Spy/CpxP family protein refolding chaperone [Coleofasciculus sp. LEGE 07092]
MLLRRVSILSVLLLSLGGVMALANPNSKGVIPSIVPTFEGQPPQKQSRLRLMEELNLTSEQMQQLHSIQQQYRSQINNQRQELALAQEKLAELMASTATVDQIRTQHEQVQEFSQQLGELSFESMLAMRDVFTPTQRHRFAQLMEQRQDEVSNHTQQQKRLDR